MAQAENQITYCSRCKRLIPPSEMTDALRMGDHIICLTCADTMTDEAKKAAGGGDKNGSKSKHATAKTNELKVVDVAGHTAAVHCSRCARWITAEDKLDSIETPTQIICPTCADSLSPEAKAALLKEAEELSGSRPEPKTKHRPKVKGKRPATHIMKSPLAAKKSGQGAMAMFAAAGIAAAVIAIVLVASGSSNRRDRSASRSRTGGRSARQPVDDVAKSWGGVDEPPDDEPAQASRPVAAPAPEPADEPPAEERTAQDLTDELERLRPADGPLAGRYGAARRALADFAGRDPDTPQAAEALKLIVELDKRYYEEADEELSNAVLSARDLAKKAEYEKARGFLERIGARFSEGDWYEKIGKPEIDTELARIEERESRIAAPPPGPAPVGVEKPGPTAAAVVVAPGPAPLAPMHFLANGSMNDGVDMPDGWTTTKKLAPGTRVFRDTKDYYGGPAALCLESLGPQVMAITTIEGAAVAGKRLAVTGYIRCSTNNTGCLLVIRAYSEKGKKIAEAASRNPEPGGTWTPLSVEFKVPAKARKLRLWFAYIGKGKAWFDEARVFDLDGATAEGVVEEAAGNLVSNGSMTAGGDLPTGWTTGKKAGARAYRDTAAFLSAPASLCAESEGGVAAANLRLNDITGPITISWHMRTDVKKRTCTMLQLHAHDKTGKRLGPSKEIGRLKKPGMWKAYRYQTVIPADADYINLVFVHTAEGKSWIDDVSIVGGSETIAGTQIARNGSMTEDLTPPSAWDQCFSATMSRDTEVYHTGPASVRLEPITKSGGGAVQNLAVAGYSRIKVKCFVKTEGNAVIRLIVQFFGAPGSHFYVAGKAKGVETWRKLTKEYVVPEGAKRAQIKLLVTVGGRGWYDDVEVYAIGK